MEDTENNVSTIPEEKLYSQKDFDEYKEKLETELQEQIEQETKKANMTELELAKSELEELKKKYQQKEDECLIAQQREETISLLKEAGLDEEVLELVYSEKDMEKTRLKIETLKGLIEKIKKEIFQDCTNSEVPLTSNENGAYDPFIDGFDTNTL